MKQKAEVIFRQMAKNHNDSKIGEILSKENILEAVS